MVTRRGLVRWKRRELLRIMARDLLGLDDLDRSAALAALATAVLGAAVRSPGRRRPSP